MRENLKEGERVEDNIGLPNSEECWIQAEVLEVVNGEVRVREVGTDDEWTLTPDNIR